MTTCSTPTRANCGGGTPALALEPLVFDILVYLVRNRDRVVGKEDLRAAVWAGRIVSESTLSSSMTAVRAAVGDSGEEQRLIRTMPRRGFRFVGAVFEGPEPAGDASREDAPGPASVSLPVQRAELPLEAGREARPVVALRPPFRRAHGIALLAVDVAGLAAVGVAALLILRPQSRPPPSIAQRFDAAKVPIVTDELRRSLATYPDRPDYKAVALATDGFGVTDGAPDIETAKTEALRQCSSRAKRACSIYAVGMDVVWSRETMPLPAPRDLRTEPMDARLTLDDLLALRGEATRAVAVSYIGGRDHKALALSSDSVWYVTRRSSAGEAARMVVEQCSAGSRSPCILASVDGFLTVQFPTIAPGGANLSAVDGAGDPRRRA